MTEDILYLLMTTEKFYKMNKLPINVDKIEGIIAAGDLIGVGYKERRYEEALLFSLPSMEGSDLCVSFYARKEKQICHLYDLLADEEVFKNSKIETIDTRLNIKSFL